MTVYLSDAMNQACAFLDCLIDILGLSVLPRTAFAPSRPDCSMVKWLLILLATLSTAFADQVYVSRITNN